MNGDILSGIHYVMYFQGAVAVTTQRTLLRRTDPRTIDRQQLQPGIPSRYAVRGDLLFVNTLGQNATDQIFMVYYRYPPNLVADGDLTALKGVWDEVILLGARWRGWRELGMMEQAELAKQDFAQMINEIDQWDRADAQDWHGNAQPDFIQYQPGGIF
jgi:hypothetical protein